MRTGTPQARPGSSGSPLLGHAGELAMLDRFVTRIAERGGALVLRGDPGIGKTALGDEFQRRARVDAPGIRIACGQCVEGYGGTEAYYAVLEALGQLCLGSEGESVVRILAQQAPAWLAQFPLQVPPLRERVADIAPLARYFLAQQDPQLSFAASAIAASAG